MPRWAKICLWATGGVALVIAAGVWSFGALTSDMCGNEQLLELPSSDGELKVVVFQRDCGATTGFSTQVSIVSAAESLPNRSGNLFVADTDHGRVPAGVGGGPEVRVAWVGARSLRIAHYREARVFLANAAMAGISAEYVTFP